MPTQIFQAKISEIFIAPERQRTKVNESQIAELAVSLKNKGQLHPVTLAPMDFVRFPDSPTHLKYLLIAGYRRLLATALLKAPVINASLQEGLSLLEIEEIELDENLQREGLAWQDEVKAKARMVDLRKQLYGDSIREVAEHVNESRGSLWEDQRLARAMKDNPELAKSKNKTSATSKLRLITRREELERKAAEKSLPLSTHTGMDLSQRVFLGDCLEITKSWADGHVHCIITDPPYGINLDKGETKKGSSHPQIYDDDTYDIMDMTARVAKEAFRLLEDNTHAYFWFDIKQYAKIFRCLSDAGFTVDKIPLIWVKPGPGQVNHPDSRWGSGYEAAFFCRKGKRPLLKQGQSNVLAHDPLPPAKKIHPVEKPTSLIRQLIETSTAPGEIILDFFGGSGSTAEAALQLQRDFRICEKDPAYHAGIMERLGGITNPKTLTLQEEMQEMLNDEENEENNNA